MKLVEIRYQKFIQLNSFIDDNYSKLSKEEYEYLYRILQQIVQDIIETN